MQINYIAGLNYSIVLFLNISPKYTHCQVECNTQYSSLVVSDNACSPHGVLLSKWHNLIDLGVLTHQIEQFGLFNKYKRPHFIFFLILTTSIFTKFQPEVFALFPYSSLLDFN